jgi:hypothetical protein
MVRGWKLILSDVACTPHVGGRAVTTTTVGGGGGRKLGPRSASRRDRNVILHGGGSSPRLAKKKSWNSARPLTCESPGHMSTGLTCRRTCRYNRGSAPLMWWPLYQLGCPICWARQPGCSVVPSVLVSRLLCTVYDWGTLISVQLSQKQLLSPQESDFNVK